MNGEGGVRLFCWEGEVSVLLVVSGSGLERGGGEQEPAATNAGTLPHPPHLSSPLPVGDKSFPPSPFSHRIDRLEGESGLIAAVSGISECIRAMGRHLHPPSPTHRST